MGKSAKVGMTERRAKSAAGYAKSKRTSSQGYLPLDDTTSQDDSASASEVETRSIRSSVSNKTSNASISTSLLTIPFERVSRPSTPISGTSASEEEPSKQLSQSLDSPAHTQEKLGSLFISLHYEFQDMSLVLKIIRAHEVAAKDMGGTS